MHEVIEPHWLVPAVIAILLIGTMLISWTVTIFNHIERIPWWRSMAQPAIRPPKAITDHDKSSVSRFKEWPS